MENKVHTTHSHTIFITVLYRTTSFKNYLDNIEIFRRSGLYKSKCDQVIFTNICIVISVLRTIEPPVWTVWICEVKQEVY